MGTEKEQTHEKMLIAQKLLYKYVPEIDNVVMYEGQGDSSNFSSVSTPHYAYTHVVLVPVSERKRDVHDIMKRDVHDIMLQIQEIWAAVLPDSKVSVQNGGFDKLVGYVSDGGGYGITLISEDLDVLYETAMKIKNHLEADPEVVTAKLDTDFDTSTMIIDMSQEYLSSLGITSYEAGITSAILFQGIDCGRYKDLESGRRYDLRITSNITDKNITADDISNLHIVTQNGQDVSFANLSDIRVEKSVSQINHSNRANSNRAKKITVTASLVGEDTSGVSQRVNQFIANNPLPNGVHSKAGGIMALIGDMITPMISF